MFGSFRARSQCSLGSSLFDGCTRARNFSTTFVLPRESKNIISLSKELTRYSWQGQARFFRNDSILTGKARWRKPPRPSPPSDCSSKSDYTSDPASCRPRPKNSKCLQPPTTCPPPCSTPRPVVKSNECPPPKICYRKCPPPPKPPKPPKCPKIPAPSPPPSLPRVPKPPKCAPPCPPPPPPPLPKCPSVPKCPECPPQRECPPPLPCEPCPCPPPCPPSSCPPPPPCPPCPPLDPCPKPLPCPPPPPPKICPPCPSCPECPKSPPCPPPRPCCPCPCPKPPAPCPCPKPCPPCQDTEPSCPKDVPSCPKNCGKPTKKGLTNGPKKRKLSTYHAVSKFVRRPVRTGCRQFHTCTASFSKGEKSEKPTIAASCKDMGDICKNGKTSEQRNPGDKREKKKKKDVCAGRKPVKLEEKKKKKEEEKDECVYKCIRRGKCDQLITDKPPKMEYKPISCPPPKFPTLAPCPGIPDAGYEANLYPESPRTKTKKEICVPPPVPKPPTDPVVLCPCPTPSKVHPGPCPCYNMKVKKPAESTMPPCPRKQYICRREEIKLCVLKDLNCKKRKTCDPKRRKKKEE